VSVNGVNRVKKKKQKAKKTLWVKMEDRINMPSPPTHDDMDDDKDESTVSNDSQPHTSSQPHINSQPNMSSQPNTGLQPNTGHQLHIDSQPTTDSQSSNDLPPLPPPSPINPAIANGYLGKIPLTPQHFRGRASPIDFDTQFDMFTIKPAKNIRFLAFTQADRLSSEGIISWLLTLVANKSESTS
jgi:hypothetical protein